MTTTAPAATSTPSPPPHGPGAARQVARTLAKNGAHSHLVAEGKTECLSGHCPTIDLDTTPMRGTSR